MIDLCKIYIHGRYHYDNFLHMYNTASGIELNINAKKLKVVMKAIPNQLNDGWMRVIIDNDYDNACDLIIHDETSEYIIYESEKVETHNIKLLKVSEAIESYIDITDIELDGRYLDKPSYDREFLVFGDSTVSAYGCLGNVNDVKTLYDTDGLKGFCYLTAKKFDATMNSLNGSGWGIAFSPWTTPKRRPLLSLYDKVAPLSIINYNLQALHPTLAIISLGTNDSFYILEGEEGKTKEDLINEFKSNYQKLLDNLNRDFPNIPIIMVYGVMREKHNFSVMETIYLENKEKCNLTLAQLDGDGMGVSGHPSSRSHQEMSEKLIEIIKVILK